MLTFLSVILLFLQTVWMIYNTYLQEHLTEPVYGASCVLKASCFKWLGWYLENLRALQLHSGSLFAKIPLQCLFFFPVLVIVPSYYFWDFDFDAWKTCANSKNGLYWDTAETNRAMSKHHMRLLTLMLLLYARKKRYS